MKRYGIAPMCAAIVLAFGAPARAANDVNATLAAMRGDVMVNHGKEFVPASVGMPLESGTRVMVAEGASAEVVFNDGCSLPVRGGTMITVPSVSTCAGGNALAQNTDPAHSGALGGAATAGALLEGAAALGEAASVAAPLTVVGVGLVTASVVVANNVRTSNDKPISP